VVQDSPASRRLQPGEQCRREDAPDAAAVERKNLESITRRMKRLFVKVHDTTVP